jgi:hypothetical protein
MYTVICGNSLINKPNFKIVIYVVREVPGMYKINVTKDAISHLP